MPLQNALFVYPSGAIDAGEGLPDIEASRLSVVQRELTLRSEARVISSRPRSLAPRTLYRHVGLDTICVTIHLTNV